MLPCPVQGDFYLALQVLSAARPREKGVALHWPCLGGGHQLDNGQVLSPVVDVGGGQDRTAARLIEARGEQDQLRIQGRSLRVEGGQRLRPGVVSRAAEQQFQGVPDDRIPAYDDDRRRAGDSLRCHATLPSQYHVS